MLVVSAGAYASTLCVEFPKCVCVSALPSNRSFLVLKLPSLSWLMARISVFNASHLVDGYVLSGCFWLGSDADGRTIEKDEPQTTPPRNCTSETKQTLPARFFVF